MLLCSLKMVKMAVLIKQQNPAKNSGERNTAAEFIFATNRKIEANKLLIKEIQAIVQNNREGNPKKNKKSEKIRSQSKMELPKARRVVTDSPCKRNQSGRK